MADFFEHHDNVPTARVCLHDISAYVDQWLHLAKSTGEFDRIFDANRK